MLESQSKLLFGAFIIILIGVVLIQSIGNDVELTKIGSNKVTGEALSFLSLTTAISNESHVVINNTPAQINISLTYDDLVSFTELRNSSATKVNGLCNVTLSTGRIKCNQTNSSFLYADYTYVSGRTEETANDELISVIDITNSTGTTSIIGHCNVTLSVGELVCNNTHNSVGKINYTYEPDTYVSSSSARAALTLTVVFFALAILGIAIGYAWKSLKDGGVI